MKNSIALTVLATKRPELLARTLASVAPILDECFVIGLNNGGDPEVRAMLKPISAYYETRKVFNIGEAVSSLVGLLPGYGYWLHLEDDWEADWGDGDPVETLAEAVSLLDSAPLVRLRSHADHTDAQARGIATKRHQVTGQEIRFAPLFGTPHLIGEAHYTLNPSVIRAADARSAWPASGEPHAQRRWDQAGKLAVVQMVPGVFRHIGEGMSA